ncbi:MAG: hypothetical protein NTW86_14005, partial [Candidatus Sumerlaeota bacterium]|nr:hypothetical protein [Candidatus Sumerlaeota bacterium]
MRFLLLCVLCLYAPGPDRAVAAEAAPENTVSLEGVVGFSPKSGQARPGCFTPVHVQLTTKGEPFRGEIVVRSIAQKPQAFDPLLAFPCEVGINTVKRFSDIFYVRDSDQTLLAELWVKGKKIGETHMGLEMIPASRHTILALAEADGRLDHLAAAGNPLPARRRKVIYGLAEYLPTHSRGYDGDDSV